MTTNTFNGLRHGEALLIPVNEIPGINTRDSLPQAPYVLADSDAGHDHVLEGSDFYVYENTDGRIFVDVRGDTAIVHKKTHDNHRTLHIPANVKLERYEMVEYNPASKLIQKVVD